MISEAYAAYNVNANSRSKSSSGGIYDLLARQILSEQGVVFAVCYDEQFETLHREIRTIEELVPSLGSKYVPSKLNDTFGKIKEHLSEGHKVLFVGTPCQCAGLQSFIHVDDDNLICIDFICHGVPSRVVWRKFLSILNHDDSLTRLNMRDKSSGWSDYNYSWSLQYGDNKKIIMPQREVLYMKGFTSDYYLRPSCYECRFKGIERKSDITLGDYWGIWDIQPEMDNNKGTSLILLHSEKGKKLLDDIRNELYIKEAILEEAIKRNPSIVNSAEKTDKRNIFFEKLQAGEDFEKIMKTMMKVSWINKLKNKAKSTIKKIIGK